MFNYIVHIGAFPQRSQLALQVQIRHDLNKLGNDLRGGRLVRAQEIEVRLVFHMTFKIGRGDYKGLNVIANVNC